MAKVGCGQLIRVYQGSINMKTLRIHDYSDFDRAIHLPYKRRLCGTGKALDSSTAP